VLQPVLLQLEITLTVTGNAINSSTATAITLDGANVTVAGYIKVGGNDIQSSGGTTAITLDSSNVTVKGNLTVDSNTTLKGNITLGDTAGDTVSFGATVSSHIIPSVNDKDLGSLTNPWRKIYGQGINVTSSDFTNINVTGIATIATLGVTGLTTTKNLVVFDTVGIGTDNPLQKLQIGVANTLGHSTDGKVFVITEDAKVGIGTTNPLAKLDVRGDVYIKDDLTVDGGDVKSANASLNLFNTNVTTANILDAGTNIVLGATTGITTIRNATLDLDGDLNVDGGDVTSNTASLNLFNSNVTTANVLGAGTNIVLGATTGITTIRNATLDLDGDLNVDGGDVTSNTASLNLFNSNVTTANVLGAGTNIVLGATTGITTIKNSLTVDGNTILGVGAGDTVSFGATVSSHIIPSADATYNLGSTNNRWKNIFTEGSIKVDESLTTKDLNVTGIATIGTLGVTGLTTTKDLIVFDTVGIGTTNPLAKLDVRGDISGVTVIKASDNNTNITLTSNTLTTFAGDIKVGGNDIQSSIGTTAITLDAANVSVGGTLTVKGNDIKSSTETAITLSGANVTAKGNLTVDGNTTLGNAPGDIVSFGATVGTGITPSATNTHDLGSTDNKWKEVHATKFVGAITGNAATATQVGVGITTGTTSHYLTFVASNNATRANEYLYSDDGISYNPSTNDLTISGIVTATQLSTGLSGTGVNITTNTISGPALLTIDPSTVGDNTGAVRIKGDLYVDGTQFIVNSTTIELADFIVGIASTATTDELANGAGIKIGPDNTLTYDDTYKALKSSENFNLASGKKYMIDGVDIGTPTSFPTLTSIGILEQLQVTGISTFTNGPVLIGEATLTGTADQRLQVTGGAYISDKVGIGTTNPLEKLDVRGAITGVTSIKASDNTTNITLTSGTLTAFAGDIKVGGNNIKASDGTTAITLDNANVTAKGNLTVDGNTTLGNAAGDIVSFGATVGTGITPSATNTHELGSENYQWKKVWAEAFSGSLAGNSNTATKLATQKNIAITGDLTWNVNFDGSVNVSSAGTLSDTGVTAGIYGSATQVGIVTVDAKGRITAASNIPISIGGASLSSIAAANQVLYKNSNNTEVVGSAGLIYNGNALNVGIGTTVSIGGDAGRNIELGIGATNIATYIDFYGSALVDYSARIIRQPGSEGNFIITNTGTGNIHLETTVSFGATVSSHIVPSVPGTHNLGSETLKWGTVYATAFNGPITGNVTGTASYADNAGISTNLKEGTNSQIFLTNHHQTLRHSFSGTTTGGTVLQSNGVDSAPSWVNATGLTVSKASYATRCRYLWQPDGRNCCKYLINFFSKYQVRHTQVLSAGTATGQLLQSNGSGVSTFLGKCYRINCF
jgi:hypothetical protein